MVFVLLSRIVLLVFGTLYPAYASYKTVKTKNVRDYVKWMMYWIVFAFYSFIEIFTDIFFAFWFPFYYQIKILFVFWLICPATRGSTYLFKKVINPQLSKREVFLDSYIDSLWDQGYDIARKIGAQGVEYLGHLFLELLHKGQVTAANFLPKVNEIAQTDAVIQKPEKVPSEGNISDENTLDEADFAILMADSPEIYKDAVLAASKRHFEDPDYQPSESDSGSDEEYKSVKSRPLKVASKNKGKNMVLRERKKKTAK